MTDQVYEEESARAAVIRGQTTPSFRGAYVTETLSFTCGSGDCASWIFPGSGGRNRQDDLAERQDNLCRSVWSGRDPSQGDGQEAVGTQEEGLLVVLLHSYREAELLGRPQEEPQQERIARCFGSMLA